MKGLSGKGNSGKRGEKKVVWFLDVVRMCAR